MKRMESFRWIKEFGFMHKNNWQITDISEFFRSNP